MFWSSAAYFPMRPSVSESLSTTVTLPQRMALCTCINTQQFSIFLAICFTLYVCSLSTINFKP